MPATAVLIANRGEIAIRIAHACAALGLRCTVVYSQDDAQSQHVRRGDRAYSLPGRGAPAYLDAQALIQAALESGCQAVHPGYGFLSESAAFASACAHAGLIFIGPSPAVLALFGDKVQARAAATLDGVPVLAGTAGTATRQAIHGLFEQLRSTSVHDRGPAPLQTRALMIKAVAGGGGRGMRIVSRADQIDEAYALCEAEALAAFGRGDLYAEELLDDARHIEIQILGDGTGAVSQFGERECSLQRRQQKLIEIAPSPSLPADVRQQMIEGAVRMASRAKLKGLATFEFLLDREDPQRFVFIEANARLQVEHPVTEAVYGVDLVQAQIRVALGQSLGDLGLTQAAIGAPRGVAIQMRVNLESLQADGQVRASQGTITAYDMPSGPGVRVDGFGTVGYTTSLAFDALLAKIIVHCPSAHDVSAQCASAHFEQAMRSASRALDQTVIAGITTNLPVLRAILRHPRVIANDISTRWIDQNAVALLTQAQGLIGMDAQSETPTQPAEYPILAGTIALRSPTAGTLIALDLEPGERVHAGQTLAVIEAMKMQHVVSSPASGVVRRLDAASGQMLSQDQPILLLEPDAADATVRETPAPIDPDRIRPDLAAALARHALTLDHARPDAIARRHASLGRSARENIEDLVDPDSFIEYGALAIAAQRSRHAVEQLQRTTPADGLVAGIATVNRLQFAAHHASQHASQHAPRHAAREADPADDGRSAEITRTVVMAYDYTVLAGTQGAFNHQKKDRLLKLAAELRLPVVLFAEGGGGRPGDTDQALVSVAGLNLPTFKAFARLSGQVPLIGVVHGRCFAGNAALLGCCDVIIATRASNIGMGGPAMIEGGGLGVFRPEDVGPVAVQWPNGVIDCLVDDEREAVATAKQALSNFQGRTSGRACADQRTLREAVPENRLRAYEVRRVLETLADTGSVLELRRGFGAGIITALVRIEGRAVGMIANNPMHLGGAIDAEAADKAARFVRMCAAHGLALVSLCDTPGFMVGPEAERTAQVRRMAQLFIECAALKRPPLVVVLRKGYGLGAMAMAGGDFGDTAFTIAWPSGEFGGMGIEGAVRLAYRKELAAIIDPVSQQAEFDRRVAELYAHGQALNMAAMLEIDAVIDPAQTRRWIIRGLETMA